MNYPKIVKTILLLFVLVGCKHKADIPSEPAISFASQVQPIVVNNCAQSGCHDGSGRSFSLIDYSKIIGKVNPGDAANSRLYTSIINRSMPPNNPLTDEQTKLIYIWIIQGAENN
jgi:hypothetical protein